jgi:hypothetical protein
MGCEGQIPDFFEDAAGESGVRPLSTTRKQRFQQAMPLATAKAVSHYFSYARKAYKNVDMRGQTYHSPAVSFEKSGI